MKKLTLLLMLLFALSSCTKSDIDTIEPSESASTELSLKMDGFDIVASRAANDSAVAKMTMLQFVNGVYTFTKTITNVNIDGVTVIMDLKTMANSMEEGEENILIFAANFPDNAFDGLTIGSSTYADYKSFSTPVSDFSTHLPMVGYYQGVLQEKTTNRISATLTRAVAKIDYTVNVDNFIDSQGVYVDVTIDNIELCDIPKDITLYACENRPALPIAPNAGLWPDYTKMEPFPDYSVETFCNYDSSADQNTDAHKALFYMPENVRGSFDELITTSYTKIPESLSDEYNKGLTYAKVTLSFEDTYKGPSQATYRIYLGGNALGDMNILRNTEYRVTTTIGGANSWETDTRIDVIFYPKTFDYTNPSVVAALTGLSQGDLEVQYNSSMNANCYILNPVPYEKGLVFYIPIEDKINNFWTNYEGNTSYQLSSADTWYVDILWSDIEGITHAESNSPTAATTSGGFSVQRVASAAGECYANTPKNQSALKVTLPNTFNTPSKHGNIVVGIRKSTTNIGSDYCWSWHFWITDYNPYSVTSAPTAANQVGTTTDGGYVFTYGDSYWSQNSGKWIMDRAIGSVSADNYATDNTTNSARGILYYQYGRKDPFTLYPSGTYSYTNVSSNTISTGTIVGGVKSPAKFDKNTYGVIYDDSSYRGTSYPWNDKKLNNMSEKSIFDPSPLGWKLAVNGTWSDFSETTFLENGSYHARRYEVSSSIYANYPASGCLGDGYGSFTNGGLTEFCWSCLPSSSYFGYNLYFDSSDVYTQTTASRGYGFPVVPLQE